MAQILLGHVTGIALLASGLSDLDNRCHVFMSSARQPSLDKHFPRSAPGQSSELGTSRNSRYTKMYVNNLMW